MNLGKCAAARVSRRPCPPRTPPSAPATACSPCGGLPAAPLEMREEGGTEVLEQRGTCMPRVAAAAGRALHARMHAVPSSPNAAPLRPGRREAPILGWPGASVRRRGQGAV